MASRSGPSRPPARSIAASRAAELPQALLVLGGRIGVGDDARARLQVGDAVARCTIVRSAMQASIVPSGREYSTAPPYGPRRILLRAPRCSCIARTFGAPVTVPAGKQARSTSNGVTPSPELADDLGDEVRHVRETLHLHGPRDAHGARRAHAREVVAAEIDEHHVLGAVLLGREQSLDVALGRLGRAGDGAEARVAVLARDEPLGRGADERDPVELEQEQIGRRVHAPQRAVDVERRGRGRPLRALRGHALEDVAGDDVLLHALDHLEVARPVRRAADRRSDPTWLAPPGDAGLESPRDLLRVARQHLGHAGAVVEADERLADDEPRPRATRHSADEAAERIAARNSQYGFRRYPPRRQNHLGRRAARGTRRPAPRRTPVPHLPLQPPQFRQAQTIDRCGERGAVNAAHLERRLLFPQPVNRAITSTRVFTASTDFCRARLQRCA